MAIAHDMKDIRECAEVNSEVIDDALNTSRFLSYSGEDERQRQRTLQHRRLVKEAGERISDEFGWVRRNLTLRIKLYDLENDANVRVRYIEISTKNEGNILECYNDDDGQIVWKFSKTCMELYLWHLLEQHTGSIAKAGSGILVAFSNIYVAILVEIVPLLKEYIKTIIRGNSSNDTQ